MQAFKSSLIVSGLMLLSSAAYADSWSCSHNGVQREVKIEYLGSGPVPCNVVYNKSAEGGSSEVLWNATSEQGYCEDKAQGLVAKLESWGWACTNNAAASDSSEPMSDTHTMPAGDASEPASDTHTMPAKGHGTDTTEPAMPD